MKRKLALVLVMIMVLTAVMPVFAEQETKPVEPAVKEEVKPEEGKEEAKPEEVKEEVKPVEEKVEEVVEIEEVKALVSKQPVTLDGKDVVIGAYNIAGENYVKLRDVSALLKETDVKFSVIFEEEKNEVLLVVKGAYEANEEDLKALPEGEKTAIASLQPVKKAKVEDKEKTEAVEIKGFNIDGFNYYRLRDLGKALEFGVAFDFNKNTVLISSKEKELKDIEKIKEEGKEEVKDPTKLFEVDMLTDLALKADNGEGQPEIVVYGHDECPYCIEVKEYLNGKNIKFTYKNTRTEEGVRAEYDKFGKKYVPVVIVGPYLMEGFNAEAIDVCIEACKLIAAEKPAK